MPCDNAEILQEEARRTTITRSLYPPCSAEFVFDEQDRLDHACALTRVALLDHRESCVVCRSERV